MVEDSIKTTKDGVSPLSIGSTVEGTVVAKDRSSLYLDLGVYGTGVVYGREFYEAKELIKSLNINDKIRAKVLDLENDDGYKELSLSAASREVGWGGLKEKMAQGEIFKIKVLGANKGGLLANVDGIAAFLPVSQLAPEHYPRIEDAEKQKILKELQKFIGKTLEVKILDIAPEESKLILSEKATKEEKVKEILKNFKKGDVVDGEISGIAGFGAFIKFPLPSDLSADFVRPKADSVEPKAEARRAEADAFLPAETLAKAGAKEDLPSSPQIEGLIHISELDWQLVEDPTEIVKVGEKVQAQIIEINNNQVFLSLKCLKNNPWQKIEKKYKKGDIIKGRVIKLNPFGAFVEIISGDKKEGAKVRGLCHISEFKTKTKMEETLKVGNEYDFEVASIDAKEYRISLKLSKN